MSDKDKIVTDIGLAEDLKMDEFVQKVVAQMFDQDNDVVTLQCVLNGTGADKAPTLEIELKLTSIDGIDTAVALGDAT